MPTDQDLYDQLSLYTLELRDPGFLHQHFVDAYAAQRAGAQSRPMALVFALVGLYLYVEKDCTGREVQRIHRLLAARRRSWVAPLIPSDPARIGIGEVLAATPGDDRNLMIRRWCEEVWRVWRHVRPFVEDVLSELD